jgi:uncharacterized protein (DUF433 family)
METTVRAVFRNGVFVPTTACDIPENTEVEVFVEGAARVPPREKEAKIIELGRGPQIAGSRITGSDVMDYLKHGWHRDRIAMLFRLSSRDIQVAIDYIEAHRAEVDVEYQKILDRHHNYRYPPEVQAKIDRCRQRAGERLKEIRSRPAQGGRDDAEDLRTQAPQN